MTKYTSILRTCICVLVLSLGLSACGIGYKINVLQGNFLDQEKIDQIDEGMTRNQVKYLLGTPMIADSFHEDRWDYVYSARYGNAGVVVQRKVTVFFEGNSVLRVEQYGQDEETDDASPDSSSSE